MISEDTVRVLARKWYEAAAPKGSEVRVSISGPVGAWTAVAGCTPPYQLPMLRIDQNGNVTPVGSMPGR